MAPINLENDNMKRLRMLAVGALCLAPAVAFASGNVQAGKQVAAQVCGACHGLDGISSQSNIPNLAGQKQAYLVSQIKGFRSGKIKNATMHAMASSIPAGKINDVAAYYSSLKSCK